jgi:hypothetical protein
MPSADAVLASLTAIANEWRSFAIAWHLFFANQILALCLGCRPSQRTVAFSLVFPVVSVSALAWLSGNPFNGLVFLALAFLLRGLAYRLTVQPVRFSSGAMLAAGSLLLIFGWVYPHFLAATRWIEYAYAAPLGLLPCPTLAALIGLTLILDLLQSKAWSLALATAGLAYGAIGVFRLGVPLDYGLLAGAIVLAGVVIRRWIASRSTAIGYTHREEPPALRAA